MRTVYEFEVIVNLSRRRYRTPVFLLRGIRPASRRRPGLYLSKGQRKEL